MKKNLTRLGLLLALAVGAYIIWYTPKRSSSDHEISFNQDVQPILATKCYPCHGPDDAKREADLRLDLKAGMYDTLESGFMPIDLSDLSESAILHRITSTDRDLIMPPPDFPQKLNAKEVAIITQWIDDGAEWQNHWSYEPLDSVPVPESAPSHWSENPIDAFIYETLQKKDLEPSPRADLRTLYRRLHFDLVGLPPTPDEVNSFVQNQNQDAYPELVDKLLSSSRYGERWARHWLDVVHYGETHGYDKDHRRPHAWPYRDYVIDAFNNDLPYGRFVQDQIAGDVLFPDSPSSTVALGFLAAGPWDLVGHVELREGTLDKRIVRNLDRDDIVTNVVSTFTGLTVQCARCHDHKFDPIRQSEYYGLQSVFAGIDRANRPFDQDPGTHKLRTVYRDSIGHAQRRLEKIEELLDTTVIKKLNENIALQKKTASDNARLLNPPSPTFGFHSRIEKSPDHTKWIMVDLGQQYSLEEIILVPAHPTDGIPVPGYGFPLRFNVEVAQSSTFADGVVILDHSQADHHERTDKAIEIPLDKTRARFVKITANKIWKGRAANYLFALAEIQAKTERGNVARQAKITASDTWIMPKWKPAFLIDGFSSRRLLGGETTSYVNKNNVKKGHERMHVLQREEQQLRRSGLPTTTTAELDEIELMLNKLEDSLEALPHPEFVYAATHTYPKAGNFQPPDSIRPIFVLERGDTEQPRQPAVPSAVSTWDFLPAVLDLDVNHKEEDRRAALAKWLTDKKNAFTWRSIVNRVWQYHFGKGLVASPNDFGKMGVPPTHPKLLDYLTYEFLRNGQSIKWLHRLIVTSQTYQQSSQNNVKNYRIDSENRFLWRSNRRQLEAEVIWDGVLAISGKLDLKMGGESFDAFRFEDDHSPRYVYKDYNAYDPTTFRRAIYRTIVRSVPDPFLTTLDCADPSQSVPVRNETTTALQALSALNNRFMVRQSDFFAQRLQHEEPSLQEQIRRGISLALQRDATSDEIDELTAYASQHGLAATCRIIFALNEFLYAD